MEKQKYKLETSIDGEKWKFVASFLQGEPSRFNLPIDANVVVMEAKEYVKFWKDRKNPKPFNYCRVVIDIPAGVIKLEGE